MLDSIRVKYLQVVEAWADGGLKNILHTHPQVFKDRLATPVYMDLTNPAITPPAPPKTGDFLFAEIKLKDVQAGKWTFAVHSRGIKSGVNLKCGLRSFAVVEGSTVVGDIWFYIPPDSGGLIAHPELGMLPTLDIHLTKGDVYAFDMVIAPAYRGKNLAAPLQRYLQASLKAEGYQKVYGYYWDDNIPALWMHRMLKFKELPKKCISRFFFRMQVKNADTKNTKSPEG